MSIRMAHNLYLANVYRTLPFIIAIPPQMPAHAPAQIPVIFVAFAMDIKSFARCILLRFYFQHPVISHAQTDCQYQSRFMIEYFAEIIAIPWCRNPNVGFGYKP